MKKKIFITGSTDGIGKLAAQVLAKVPSYGEDPRAPHGTGHELILHGRNPEKLHSVIEEIQSSFPDATVSGYVSDFSDSTSVKTMAEKIVKEHDSIDVLINNAGVFKAAPTRDKDVLDIRFKVNYLAPVILTTTLLPSLKNGTNPRVINVSSAAQAPVSIDALLGKTGLTDQDAYAQSKLALTMWNSHMTTVHNNVVFIAVNPGSLLDTKMVKEAFGNHWSPASKGADILVELAIDPKHSTKSGAYFDNDNGGYGRAHPNAYNQDKIEQLMDATHSLTNN